MKKRNKILGLMVGAVALVGVSIMGTMAYLTSTDTVKNTFTVGNVKIKLDEAKVDEAGKTITGNDAERVKENTYHVYPGMTYDKDPMVTVLPKSEESYIRMKVRVVDANGNNKIDELKAAFPEIKYPSYYSNGIFLLEKLVQGWDSQKWPCVSASDSEYQFRYYTSVKNESTTDEVTLVPLFTHIVIPNTVENTELAHLGNLKIEVVAEAIQKEGFTNADAAWTAFDAQKNPATEPEETTAGE